MEAVKSFSKQMRAMRERLQRAKRVYFKLAVDRVFLTAVEIYCEGVEGFSRDLGALGVKSRGLRAFREYLTEYVGSVSFRNLVTEAEELTSKLSRINYCLRIKDNAVTVRHFEGESDYSAAVEATFEKFRRNSGNRHWLEGEKLEEMNHVRAHVLDRLALLHPDTFDTLEAFGRKHGEYLDEKIARFDREIQFDVAYLAYVEKFRRVGLRFCRPQVSQTSKEIAAHQTFDLALADKLVRERSTVVCNDFALSGCERVFVVSGPNQFVPWATPPGLLQKVIHSPSPTRP